jgi:two-component system LytT family response regulator
VNKIISIIVDDEQDSRETLLNYLGKYCPQVSSVAECAILKHQPKLVFLDIEMPHGNAFDLLEQFGEVDFEIIFITAFSQYAVQAFNLSAAYYLLKPVDIEELGKAVEGVAERLSQKDQLSHAKILLENMAALNAQNRKLVLPLMDVLFCEAQDNFTCFYFTNGKKALICRNLKFYEKALNNFGFCRVHRSHIINLEYVKRYVKGKGGTVVLENGKEIMVSNNKKVELMRRIKEG